MISEEQKQALFEEMNKLHERTELSKTVGPDYYEPGMMEYLDQSDGSYDSHSHELCLRFEARGTRYAGRTERIEHVHVGDLIQIVRDPNNPYNANNFVLHTAKGQDVGNMPAELCNAIAPLYDNGAIKITSTKVGGVDKSVQGIENGGNAMCNSLGQAQLLNEEKSDLNIVIGLCVGHDSMFFRASDAPVTVLGVKDKVLAHNPLACLYVVDDYYHDILFPPKE